MLGVRIAGAWRPIDCLKPHQAHQPSGPASADPHALAAQVKCHPTGAVEPVAVDVAPAERVQKLVQQNVDPVAFPGDIGRVAALWLAARGTGPSGGRLAVAVVESAATGEPR